MSDMNTLDLSSGDSESYSEVIEKYQLVSRH